MTTEDRLLVQQGLCPIHRTQFLNRPGAGERHLCSVSQCVWSAAGVISGEHPEEIPGEETVGGSQTPDQ